MDFTKIFLAGLGSYLSPCVYPLIPIYLTSLFGSDIEKLNTKNRGILVWRSLFFSFGFILVFSIMGLGAAGMGVFIQDHKAAFQLFAGVLVLLFALKFLGLIQIPMLDVVVRKDDSSNDKVGIFSAFLMGFFFAAGWSPCIGPILGSVLTYTASKTSDPYMGMLYLTTYGIGFAVPLLITALFAEKGIAFIYKTSSWLPTFEKIIGVVLIITAGYFFMNVVGANTHVCSNTTQDPTIPNGKPIMVEFYSQNCHVCKKMKPIVEGIQNTCRQKKVDIRLVDISKPENKYLVTKHHLKGVPVFMFITEKGDVSAKLIGAQTEETLFQALATMLGDECEGVGPIPTGDEKSTIKEGASCGSDTEDGAICTE